MTEQISNSIGGKFLQHLRLKTLVLMILVFFSTFSIALAQTKLISTNRWLCVTTSAENEKYYVRDDRKKIADKRYEAWVKIQNYEGSYDLNLGVWECDNRRFEIRHTAVYDRNGKLLSSRSVSDRQMVVPDSVAESVIKRICGESEMNTWIEITVSKASMRSSTGTQ